MKQRTKADWKQLGVELGDEVDPSRIADGAIIHSGCRISGAETSIGPDCVIGAEAPGVIDNCRLGRNVELKGGCFSGAVFFDGANMGSGAHVRPGTILEEEAGGAHTVGLKQTILLPFVTLGSLINFCDILMAGGTSRRNHSEVGSSYVHFNYTPHQDKATASLAGDVPNGVFLDQPPIFLGGVGGLMGPARIAYGSVIAAGGVCRQDMLEEGMLLVPASPDADLRPYEPGVYRKIDRLVQNNLNYIGNLIALREWYRHVRVLFVRDDFDRAVVDGGLENLELVLSERIKRLGELAGKMEYSIQRLEKQSGIPEGVVESQKRLLAEWPDMKARLVALDSEPPEDFVEQMSKLPKDEGYVKALHSIDPALRETGRAWLQSIVDGTNVIWS
ncbi:MAG: hypothetical protein KJN98_04360 [Pontiella sp.]|nr:hypothetical protein [Pontiella sp.]